MKIKTLSKTEYGIIQALELPAHKRTIRYLWDDYLRTFKDEGECCKKHVRIPDLVVIVLQGKQNEKIFDGIVLTRDLSYKIDFGDGTCNNGAYLSDIYEYIDWYWNSFFLSFSDNQLVENINFLKCHWRSMYYYAALEYNPNKILSAKEKYSEHIRGCNICQEM